MAFTITISETTTIEADIGNRWDRLEVRPDGSIPYGHTPPHIATKEVTVERFKQTVDTLDIAEVVRVVNGLKS